MDLVKRCLILNYKSGSKDIRSLVLHCRFRRRELDESRVATALCVVLA